MKRKKFTIIRSFFSFHVPLSSWHIFEKKETFWSSDVAYEADVPPFIENYYQTIVKRDCIITVIEQKDIQTEVIYLAELIDEKEAIICNSPDVNVSLLWSASTGSRKTNLGFEKLDEEPGELRGPKKLLFLLLVKRDVLELLSPQLLKNLCTIYANLQIYRKIPIFWN